MTDLPTPNSSAARQASRPTASRGTSRPRPQTAKDTDENAMLNPMRVWHAVRRRWWPILVVGVPLALMVAAAVWKLYPVSFTATAILKVSSVEPRMVFNTAEQPADFDTYRQTQISLLKSKRVMMGVLENPAIGGLPAIQKKQFPVEWLREKVWVSTDDSPEFLKVSMSGQDPEMLANVVNAVTDSFFTNVVNVDRQQRAARLAKLERIFEETNRNAKKERARAKELAEKLGTGDSRALTVKQQMAEEYFAELRQEHAAIRAELMREQVKASAAANMHIAVQATDGDDDSTTKANVIAIQAAAADDIDVQMMAKRVVEIRGVISRYEDIVADRNHPHLVAYRKELRDLELALKKRIELLTYRKRTNAVDGNPALATEFDPELSRLEVLVRQEQVLREEVEKHAKLIEDLGTKSYELESMQTDMKQITDVADRVAEEIETLRVELQSPPRIEVLQPAEPPEILDAGKKQKLSLLAFVGVLGLTALGFLGPELLAQRVATSEEVTQRTGMPMLGQLDAKTLSQCIDSPQESIRNSEVDTIRAVLQRTRDSQSLNTVVVAGTSEDDDAANVAFGLAAAFARAGVPTAIVDCDLAHARHRIQPAKVAVDGFAELLRGEVSVPNVGEDVAENLTWIPVGHVDSQAHERLVTSTSRTVVTELGRRFKLVILKASAFGTSSETALLCELGDGVVLPVRRDQARLPDVEKAVEKLNQLNVPVLGGILTS
ncbi:GumC family protein [Thalassoroseus pseudoceratinae]|uniref:GumC family protein n=1 Tax=Thalassoroseus pseudoceratinae TaxID=2713176 RepID=UPI0014230DB4|nr:hypothetical protein [Thalassoroseus pseudoceratinae]